MNLGYSRMQYFEFTTDVSTENVIKMHMKAFRYTGGIPSEMLFDNMKQILIDRNIKGSESRFNETFLCFSEYYGFNIQLCFPYRSRTKGKIERNIGYLGGNFFNGRNFSSLDDVNAQCSSWLAEANGKRNATTAKVPADAVKDEILTHIDSVPEFRYRINVTGKTSRECYVHYNSNRYSIPWKYAGRECTVKEKTERFG